MSHQRTLILSLTLVALAATSAAQRRGRMPDSPTGRMAGALVDLADASDEAFETFLGERVAPDARESLEPDLQDYRDTLDAPEMQGAQKTGPFAATLTLTSAGASYRVSYEVESEEPNRLSAFSLAEEERGAGRAGLPPVDVSGDRAPAEVSSEYFAKLAEGDAFSGSILVARGDTLVYEAAFGLADRESNRPNRSATLFDVGSITKIMTKVAIGQLARDGKLSLADTVGKHLPDYPNPDVRSRVTIDHLVQHRSGLGDIFNAKYERMPKESLLDPEDFFPLFVDEPLQFDPGTSQSYSNAGYVLLGAIVAAASGVDYVEYMNTHVFERAGITDEGFISRNMASERIAVGYTSGMGRGPIQPNTGMLPVRGCPAGSTLHTAAGLYRFERALSNGILLGPEWTRWFHGNSESESSEPSFAVGGGGPGVNAMLSSEEGWTFVVFANQDPPAAERALERLQQIWQP